MPSGLGIFVCTGRKAVRREDEGHQDGGGVRSSRRGLTCCLRSVPMALRPWDSLLNSLRVQQWMKPKEDSVKKAYLGVGALVHMQPLSHEARRPY